MDPADPGWFVCLLQSSGLQWIPWNKTMTVLYRFSELTRAWSNLSGRNCIPVQSVHCILFYIIMTCFNFIITHRYIIVTSFLPDYYVLEKPLLHSGTIITWLLRVIAVIMVVLSRIITAFINYYRIIKSFFLIIKVSLLPIITVIMNRLLPIIARSIIGNNRFIITYYWPGQLGIRMQVYSSGD